MLVSTYLFTDKFNNYRYFFTPIMFETLQELFTALKKKNSLKIPAIT